MPTECRYGVTKRRMRPKAGCSTCSWSPAEWKLPSHSVICAKSHDDGCHDRPRLVDLLPSRQPLQAGLQSISVQGDLKQRKWLSGCIFLWPNIDTLPVHVSCHRYSDTDLIEEYWPLAGINRILRKIQEHEC
eukprot:g56048.t1